MADRPSSWCPGVMPYAMPGSFCVSSAWNRPRMSSSPLMSTDTPTPNVQPCWTSMQQPTTRPSLVQDSDFVDVFITVISVILVLPTSTRTSYHAANHGWHKV
ncbi:hypothetical protein BD309DRAFT_959682 [Dichomitus squalens]|uniref:Uncharacterized protein n=1 Tax=Dichomitus squalens TaxID=114155 RepID=A0A4Q9NQN1_9APHY|nr:hypothetical protein BD309DRAFT_959682 [Dichomitus squalens]TBU56683.1 hypothetical protein BD310DRAFT_930853 [Dichomitus squalens]